MKALLIFLLVTGCFCLQAQQVKYPEPIKYLAIKIEQQPVRMAYMDVKPGRPNGQTVLLLHGKNFNGYYWKDVISFLQQEGYRVIVPDQVGFGFSEKPPVNYSFHLLASNTMKLLDTLGIRSVNIIAHSMGGMLASRFILMYPERVSSVVYENPIGLEDFKTFVPYRSFDEQYSVELKADYNSMKKYQQSYFPEWKPAYDQYVQAQWDAQKRPSLKQAAWASAATYAMIYEQPVLYEFSRIKTRALLIIGQADRTVVGKQLLSKELAGRHGNYPALGKWLNKQLENSSLVELEGVGHIPHIQVPDTFRKQVLSFFDLIRDSVNPGSAGLPHGNGASAVTVREPTGINPEWSKPYAPFRIAGNLYYVGTYDLASYLLVTSQGNILINTGLANSASSIASNIEALGFRFSDTKVLLTTQAHFDHMGAMAEIKSRTGARIYVDEGDSQVMRDGGRSDYALGGPVSLYQPVLPDSLLHDGAVISLGETNVVMLHHPGHTKGSCSFLVDVKDSATSYRVLIANMPTIVTDERFSGIKAYPAITEDYRTTISKMKGLTFDLWVSSHASQFDLHVKHKPGDPYNPKVFSDRKGYDSQLAELEAAFLKKLKQ